MWSKTRKNQQGYGEDGEEQWGSTGSREEHKDLRANQGSGRGRSKVPPTRLPARAWPSQWRLPKPQPLARFPQAQGLTLQARLLLTPPAPPPSPALAVWQRRSAGCWGPWRQRSLLSTPLPAHPSLAPHCRSDHVVGDFHRGSGGGPTVRSGARAGAGRVGGVKVEAQQNHPPLSERPDLRCDLNTGGRARQRRDVAQSSPDAPQHIPGSPVEVSLHPSTREPTVSSRLPGPPGFLDSQLPLCQGVVLMARPAWTLVPSTRTTLPCAPL